jgi:hypothetical protein
VQENGAINLLPGSPISTEVPQEADNNYFPGVHSKVIPSAVAFYGAYAPVGIVATNEEVDERAYAAADNDLRFHFNLPTSLNSNTLAVDIDLPTLGQ